MNKAATAKKCPLCGQLNLCAMEIELETGVKQAPCWCTVVKFDAELLARVPTEKQNLACICLACAHAASASQVAKMT